MFESFWFNLLAWIVSVAIFLIFMDIMDRRIEKYKLRKRGKKMIEAAKRFNGRFRCNWDHDVWALCTASVFQKAIEDHMLKVEQGTAKEWDKVVCYAKPLFTFACSEQTLRPIHTGRRSDIFPLIEGMMKKITGISKAVVSPEDYEKAVKMIFVRDSRLFVPYAGAPSDGEKQFAFYGKTTMAQAFQALQL
jgi:hypothetical protein